MDYIPPPPDADASVGGIPDRDLAWELIPYSVTPVREPQYYFEIPGPSSHHWVSRIFSDEENSCGCIWWCEEDRYAIVLFAHNLGAKFDDAFDLLCSLVDNGGLIRQFLDEFPGKSYTYDFRASSMDSLMSQVEQLKGHVDPGCAR